MGNYLDDVEMADNPETRIPVSFLADRSGSMSKEGRIEAVNKGMVQLKDELMANPVSSLQAELSLVSFNHEPRWLDFTPVLDFEPPTLIAKGGTLYAPAIHVALDLLDSRKIMLRDAGISYGRALAILLTDGNPHDSEKDLEAARQRIIEYEKGLHVAFFTIGIAEADVEKLTLISPPHRPPIQIGGPDKISGLISCLSNSIPLAPGRPAVLDDLAAFVA